VPIEAYRSNVMFKGDILRSILSAAAWSSDRNARKKSSGILQNFWVWFSITPIHFQCFELGQQEVLD